MSLLAIIDKYGVPISQRSWLYQALLEVSMNIIELWINVCAHDWTAERAEFANKKYYILKTLFEPASSFVRGQDATTAPSRHR